ncbi:MAG: glycosyltransferase, partial [Chloroflexales bacterium]|nr:glycosyltransferase [Chloroflexales bacterium]
MSQMISPAIDNHEQPIAARAAAKPELTVVIPMKDEAPNIPALYQRLTATLDAIGRPYELIAVDDGSRDEGPRLLRELAQRDSRLRVVRLRRNFGQTAAF